MRNVHARKLNIYIFLEILRLNTCFSHSKYKSNEPLATYFALPHLFYIKNGYNHSNHIRHCINLYKLHLQDFYTIFMTVNCNDLITN